MLVLPRRRAVRGIRSLTMRRGRQRGVGDVALSSAASCSSTSLCTYLSVKRPHSRTMSQCTCSGRDPPATSPLSSRVGRKRIGLLDCVLLDLVSWFSAFQV